MAKRKVLVIHRPGGYEAYKDQVPIRKPQWRVIGTITAFIFVCGAISSVSLYGGIQFFSPKEESTPEIIVQDMGTVDPAFSAIVSQPLPTYTASPSATFTPEYTVEPTANLQATVDFVSGQLELIQAQTALPSMTAFPTMAAEETQVVEIYSRYAIVIYDNVIIRASSGQMYEALDMAYRGQEFPVLDSYNGWTQILHPNHNPAWIATRLLRIEDR